jgi:hypothetical protein
MGLLTTGADDGAWFLNFFYDNHFMSVEQASREFQKIAGRAGGGAASGIMAIGKSFFSPPLYLITKGYYPWNEVKSPGCPGSRDPNYPGSRTPAW